MAIPKPEAPSEQQNPYLPSGPEPLVFEQFDTVNTSTTRVGVDDKQMAWCSGYFPIGPRMLRTLYGIGPTLWTTPQSQIVFYNFANLGGTPIAIIFLQDGSIWQVNTITGAAINIAGQNTIISPSTLNVGMTQWGNQYILIVSRQPNGYFIWDGNLFYAAGTLAPGVTLTNPGANYTSAPTVAASGGHGSGATFVATINLQRGVTNVVITSDGGPNFNRLGVTNPSQLTGTTVSFVGGGGSGATGVPAFAFLGTGVGGENLYAISAVTMTNTGSGYISAPSVVLNTTADISGGPNGTGPPILTAVIGSASPVTSVTITNPGTGYQVGDVVTLAFSGGGGGGGAAATVTLMPFGVSGTAIETAFQRVWVVDGPLLQWTAPSSISDLSTSNGGGSVTSNDSFLRVGYTQLVQSSGFLYLIADSSMNYISGVQTSGTPPTTTFTNQNADPEVGTPYPEAVTVFGRNIVLANSFGVHVSYGAAVTKVSEALDGVYNSLPGFGGFQLSAAKATIFGKKVWILLATIIDPVTSLRSNELLMWDGQKKWFSSKQDVTLQFINSQEINSVLTAWGTDGARLFQLFAQPTTAFPKVVQSKLWTRPGGYQFTKTTSRLWGMVQYYDTRNQEFDISVDSELSSNQQVYAMTPTIPVAQWTTAAGTVATWKTAGGATATWQLSSLGIRAFDPQAVGQQGVTSGMTITTTAADAAIIGTMISDQVAAYRG